MGEKIYFGDADIIDTRTRKVSTIKGVIYTAVQTADHSGRILHSIPAPERKYYHIKRFHIESAKVIGKTAY